MYANRRQPDAPKQHAMQRTGPVVYPDPLAMRYNIDSIRGRSIWLLIGNREVGQATKEYSAQFPSVQEF